MMMRSEFTSGSISDGIGVKNSDLFTSWTVKPHQIIDTTIAALMILSFLFHTIFSCYCRLTNRTNVSRLFIKPPPTTQPTTLSFDRNQQQ
jgi:hypothetical protein